MRYTHHTLEHTRVSDYEFSLNDADQKETYEVRTCNGDNCLYMVLEATINTPQGLPRS